MCKPDDGAASGISVEFRIAGKRDLRLLAELNRELIEDEGHANPMSVAELEKRMRGWLVRSYTAVLFLEEADVVAYALYRSDDAGVFLRQFFVCRRERREGRGRAAMQLLIGRIWPADTTVTLEALCSNKAAIAFWRALGFGDYALTLRRRTPDRDGV